MVLEFMLLLILG